MIDFVVIFCVFRFSPYVDFNSYNYISNKCIWKDIQNYGYCYYNTKKIDKQAEADLWKALFKLRIAKPASLGILLYNLFLIFLFLGVEQMDGWMGYASFK